VGRYVKKSQKALDRILGKNPRILLTIFFKNLLDKIFSKKSKNLLDKNRWGPPC
jgi:hypothetical protein